MRPDRQAADATPEPQNEAEQQFPAAVAAVLRDLGHLLSLARGSKSLTVVARELGGVRVGVLERLEAGEAEADDFTKQQREWIEAWIRQQSTKAEDPAVEDEAAAVAVEEVAAAEAQDEA